MLYQDILLIVVYSLNDNCELTFLNNTSVLSQYFELALKNFKEKIVSENVSPISTRSYSISVTDLMHVSICHFLITVPQN